MAGRFGQLADELWIMSNGDGQGVTYFRSSDETAVGDLLLIGRQCAHHQPFSQKPQ